MKLDIPCTDEMAKYIAAGDADGLAKCVANSDALKAAVAETLAADRLISLRVLCHERCNAAVAAIEGGATWEEACKVFADGPPAKPVDPVEEVVAAPAIEGQG